MAYRAWICEGCKAPQKYRDNIFDCPSCGKEGCDDCFWAYYHCKACSVGKTYGQLKEVANRVYGAEFGPERTDNMIARIQEYEN